MKVSTEYSESIQVAPDVWRKHSIIIHEEDGETLDPDEMKKLAVNYVRKWHEEHKPNGAVNPNWDHKPAETKVIDRSIERLEILIDDAKTVEELSDVYVRNNLRFVNNL